MSEKLSEAQRSMLSTFNSDFPHPVVWTSTLGTIRTWHWLHDKGLVEKNRITDIGRRALQEADHDS